MRCPAQPPLFSFKASPNDVWHTPQCLLASTPSLCTPNFNVPAGGHPVITIFQLQITTSAVSNFRHTQAPVISSVLDLLFLRPTPHIHLTIICSVLSIQCMSSTCIGHVSLPPSGTHTSSIIVYNLYTFLFREEPLDVRIGSSSLNFAQVHLTLTLEAPPHSPTISIISVS
jgi:hypothetical protein